MKKLLFILLVLAVIRVSGQSVWEITNAPVGGTIWDIEESDEGYLFTITGSGLFRSNNDGTSWEPIYFENGIIRVLTVNDAGDIIVSHDSLIYKSVDQGTNWELVLTGTGSFRSLTSADANTIYGAAIREGGNILFLSNDGGLTWDQKPMNFVVYSGMDLHVNSEGHIYCSSSEGLYKSVDQGDNWELIFDGQVRSLVIAANDDLYIGTHYNNWIQKSTDGGLTWTLFYSTLRIYPLAIDSAGYIYASSEVGLLRISPDGLNWSQISNGLPSEDIYAVHISPDGDVFVGNDGIHKSTNQGVTWIFASSGLNADSFTYITSSPDGQIYILSDALYVSADEGANYTKLLDFHDYDKVFSKVYIHPDGDIFAIGYNRYTSENYTLFRSSDNGVSFMEIIHIHINDFELGTDGSIYLASDNGLMRSIDKGDSWELMHTPDDCSMIEQLLVTQSGMIYMSNCQGTYISSNNGVTFDQVYSSSLMLKASNSEGHVFAIENSTNILRTTDNGNTWEVIHTNDLPYNQYRDLIVDAFDNLYFNISFLGIYKSIDNGDTWTLYNEGLVNNNVITMHAASNGILYIAPDYNGIWKRSGSPTFANRSSSLEVYPNPAREKITIILDYEGKGNSEICRIYDVQGRMMKEVSISSNSKEVNLEGFEPGVYLVKSDDSVKKILVQ